MLAHMYECKHGDRYRLNFYIESASPSPSPCPSVELGPSKIRAICIIGDETPQVSPGKRAKKKKAQAHRSALHVDRDVIVSLIVHVQGHKKGLI
jgi:hypothetical protein